MNKKKDLKKAYTTLYQLKNQQVIRLATEKMPVIEFTKDMEAPFALGKVTKPYGTERMWRGKERADIYLLNLETGAKEKIRTGVQARIELSPTGAYAYWYHPEDSCWYTYSTQHKKEFRLTTPDQFIAWNEEQDVPDFPYPHGAAGWTKEDKELLVYDRYDLWKVDPEGKSWPVNLTRNGRTERITYRRVSLDKEEKYIDLTQEQLLIGFHEESKGYGYYQTNLAAPRVPQTLIAGAYKLRPPVKAKNADAVIYSIETFETYPDLLLTNIRFSKSIPVIDGFRQQEKINWGTAEWITWLSLDGIPLEGVLYKPENFDPAGKYPLLVNFYERNSETLYDYRMPEPHRSTIDYHFYTSNGYVVFNPDIRYKEGYPGESCFNSVMPGIAAVVAKGYIDEKAIGAQGHSWGGYQVAYLATRTHLFAAIESGAPVVNMFSAYGGIRWETGLNRSF
ncbi:MAG: prolyl oligopeptidase family serine peptidase [Tannerellaceae bacterium]|nr:prolyl oligopeptidase family serine peptidase [Tannerellaceae bacterium]